jgi:hypothetical protein
MSSYGSTHSGYIHPSQYTQTPHHQYQQQQAAPQPPYPTTPGEAPTSQPQAYFPPTPQHHQATYSTSPASPWQQPTYSRPQNSYPPQQHMPLPHRRRSSSNSQSSSGPHNFAHSTAPIPIPTPYNQGPRISYSQPGPPVYARSEGSHHVHDHHTYADGEDGVLDEETLRSYEKRYAKDRALEKRPTLGESVLSMFKVLGSSKRE